MKCIFLDNDGVICLRKQWGTRQLKISNWLYEHRHINTDMPLEIMMDDFDKDAINILNEILLETGAQIIISSDWRHAGEIQELAEFYLSRGIITAPIGKTEDLMGLDNTFHLRNNQVRVKEIQTYLFSHPEITQWVAIDDMDLSELQNFVIIEDDKLGLAEPGIKEKIIKYLS